MLNTLSFHPESQRGAALLAVLVVALVMVILMGVVSNLLEGRVDLAQNSKDALHNKALIYTKRSELIYLLATQRHTVAGISTGQSLMDDDGGEQLLNSFLPIGDELRTDGFVYQEDSGLTFSIQNEAGLISINSSSQYWLRHWLKNNGYRNSEQMKLADSLVDYADSDNVRMPAGAETTSNAFDGSKSFNNSHNALSNIGSRNFLLQACTELWQIPNWEALLNRFPTFIEQCSLSRAGTLNLNAVSLLLWQSLWPGSVDNVRAFRTQNKWFLSNSDIISTEPSISTISDEYYTYLGNRTFRINIELGSVSMKFHAELGENTKLPIILKK